MMADEKTVQTMAPAPSPREIAEETRQQLQVLDEIRRMLERPALRRSGEERHLLDSRRFCWARGISQRQAGGTR